MIKSRLALLLLILLIVSAAYIGLRIYKGETLEYLNLSNLKYGCKIQDRCGDLVGVDCGSASDGAYYYADGKTGRIMGYCGGYCMAPGVGSPKNCRDCPPKEWTCNKFN